MKIQDLSKNPGNPRKITDAKKQMLLKALRKFGDLSGIVFNRKTKHLVGGHQRSDLFHPSTPIVITKKYSKPTKTGTVAEGYFEAKGERFAYREVHWDVPTEKAANIAANKGAGEFDPGRLKEWINELNSFDVNFDLDLTMFDADEIKDIVGIEVAAHNRVSATGTDEDEVPEQPPATTQVGDLYILGEHRLMCGDSYNMKSIERLTDRRGIDVLFTDPPYGISIVKSEGFVSPRNAPSQLAKARHYRQVEGDDKPFDPAMVLGIVAGVRILWGANHYASRLPDRAQWLIWDKKLESGKLDGNNFSDCELAWTDSDAMAAKIYRHTWAGMLRTGSRDDELAVRVHPTQKPVGLCAEILEDFSGVNEVVLDLFGGSGSTLIACEKTARKCLMMEIDPRYCDVIVARWEKYTGLKARLIRTETKLKPARQAKVQANGKQESAAAPKA